MARLSGSDVSGAVNTFLGTYFTAKREKRADEERADERRYKDFYMKLAEDQDRRSGESHAQSLEAGRLQLEQVQREAAASLAILEQEGKTLEQLVAEGKVAELGEYAAKMRELAMQQAELQTQTSKFMLESYYPAQLGQIAASTARTRALASGRGGKGGVDKELEDRYRMLQFQQKSIEDRLGQYKNSLTGEIDWARVPEPLMNSYSANSQLMSDLEAKMIPWQRDQLGLPAASGTAGPGSSEGETPSGAIDQALRQKRGPVLTPEEERAALEAKARASNVKTRKVVVVHPEDGTLVATDDDRLFERVLKAGGDWYETDAVPRGLIGQPVERYRDYLKEKEKVKDNFGIPKGISGSPVGIGRFGL